MKNVYKDRRRVYLDYAALTPIDPEVQKEVNLYSRPEYGNPAALYKEGVAARKVLDESRKRTADFLMARPNEIIFTAGGTEANSLALDGAMRVFYKKLAEARDDIGYLPERPHLIISNIEHSSIIETADMLEKRGVEVTRLPVDNGGSISLEDLKRSIKPNTCLVSVMYVNNEIGVIQPIREIAKIVRQARKRTQQNIPVWPYPLLHSDAAQAALYQNMKAPQLGVDLLTLDGSKIYGPRGIGCLFVKKPIEGHGIIEPIIYGGGQESGFRSGTENVAAAAGFAKALELIDYRTEVRKTPAGEIEGGQKSEFARTVELKEFFLKELQKISRSIIVNPRDQAADKVSPHILNVSITGIDNEFFVLQLDAKGIAVSTKSSCLRDEDESYVLKAIGADSRTGVRFSFGRGVTISSLRTVLDSIKKLFQP